MTDLTDGTTARSGSTGTINVYITGSTQSNDTGLFVDVTITTHSPNLYVNTNVLARVNGINDVYLGSPIGTIVMWGGSNPPDGWLLCDGSVINIESTESLNDPEVKYSSQYATIGGRTFDESDYTTLQNIVDIIKGNYGSQKDFSNLYYIGVKLPNLKGKFPVGVGTGTDINNTNKTFSLSDVGGEYSHKLTADESGLPSHSHGLSADYPPNLNVPAGSAKVIASDESGVLNNTAAIQSNTAKDASQYHNNIPPYIALNFIIKYK